jgi:beclin
MHAGNHASSVQDSVMGASKMDNSYVVLSRQNKVQGPRIPPRPGSAVAAHTDPNQSTRAIEGSYIVLPPPSASIYKKSASEGGGAQLTPPGGNSSSPLSGNNSGFHSSVTVLKRAFEVASSQTQVRLIADDVYASCMSTHEISTAVFNVSSSIFSALAVISSDMHGFSFRV